MDIRLYIGDRRVDLSDNIDILFNWEMTDLSNPILIKNQGYSKTVVLDGTNNNNAIFGHFWDLERYQSYGGNTGVDFNPSYRVPFTLYYNGSVYESGYVKLQKVTTNNKHNSFEIGLFGGLGGFFYNLQTDWNTGEKRALADLKYYTNSASTEEVDLSLTISKDEVSNAWSDISGNTKYGIINFAPTYAGLPTNIDTDKVLINFSGLSLTSVSGECRSYNGYALGKLPDKLTSEDVKDYRSYLQTPVIKVNKIFEAICRKENNKGKFDEGYDVICDPDFFNDKNPYYAKSWLTLPKLSIVKTSGSGGTPTEIISSGTPYSNRYGLQNGIVLSYPLNVNSDGKAKVHFELQTTVPNGPGGFLYLSHTSTNLRNVYPAALCIQCYTSDSSTLNESKYTFAKSQWITNSVMTTNGIYRYPYEDGKRYMEILGPDMSIGVDNYDGSFTKQGNTDTYKWELPIDFEIDIPQNARYLKFNIQYVNPNQSYISGVNYKLYNLFGTSYDSEFTTINFAGKSVMFTPFDSSDSYSYSEISKTDLLSTSFSPAEFLINYCKQFGLYIYKDVVEDKIYILTRNNFFKRQDIRNLDDIIDTSKSIDINPTYVDTNYVSLTATGVEGESYKDYVGKYGKRFGQKIIDTGFEFNADTKELIQSPFKTAVQTREQSIYYFQKDNGLNPYVFNGFSYNLYKNGNYDDDAITIDIPKKEISSSFQPLYEDKQYYDIIAKPQFEDDSHKGIDTEGVFLFFTGYQDVTGKGYYLSDDSSYMKFLNNKPCWLMTNSEYDSNGHKIAIAIEKMPRFSRYFEGNKWMIYSWDFGSPRELYVPDMVNNDDVNIYSLYFKKYYEDLYDINTKVVTCYIHTNNLSIENMRCIYWFRNGLWRLNKVYDYNPASPETTKVEFIKIQDVDDLTNENPTTERKITITLDRYEIGQSGGTIIGTVRTSDNFGWTIEDISYDPSSPAPRGLVTITPQTYGQSGNFTISVPSNIRDDREVTIKVNSPDPYGGDEDVSGSTSFTQPGVEYTFSFNPNEFNFGTLSESGTLNIVNPYYYDWSISSKPNWVTIVPSAIVNGQTGTTGNTACTLTVDKNTTEVERTGMVTISETTYGANYTFPVKQAGYVFSVSPNNLSFNKSGEEKTVTITNPYGYSWIVDSKPDWITTAKTDGNLTVTAAKNIVFERTGTVVIKDTDFNKTYIVAVTQESGYVFSISPTLFNFEEDGDTNTLTIDNPNEMSWSISNYPSWVTISPTAGTGTSVSVGAVQNTGLERSATSITVKEVLTDTNYYFDVTQESGYYFAVSPTALTFTSDENNQSFWITNDNGYDWEIINLPTWASVSVRTGNTSAQIVVYATKNIGQERTATITVSETTYGFTYDISLTQDSGYQFYVSPVSFSFIGDGESKEMGIVNPNNLDWQIEELPWWIEVSPVTGNSSSTTVTVTAVPNGGAARSGEFTVYESTFGNYTDISVSQASGYTFNVNPNQLYFAADIDTKVVTITNPDHYNWTASADVNWVSLSHSSGTSSVELNVTTTSNIDGDERRGTLTIVDTTNNKTFEVSLEQEGYEFSISPTAMTFISAGESKQLDISDNSNYGWEVTSYPAWIIVNATTGIGSYGLTVTARDNGGREARTGVVTIKDLTYNKTHTLSVSQESGIYFNVTPQSFVFQAAGEAHTMSINNPYNYSWTIEELPYWISVNATAGTSSETITITAQSNPSTSERSGTFVVYDSTYGSTTECTVRQLGSLLTPSWTSFTAELT